MSDKITILFSSLSGELIGGGQQSLLLYLKKIDRTRFVPVLVCPCDGTLVEIARSLGIHTSVLAMPKIARFRISSVFALCKLMKEQKIDCVHTDSPRQTVYCGIAARLCGKPLLWHVRTSMGQNMLFERFCYGISDKVIAVSKTAALRFPWAENDRKNKMEVVYNGVDIDEFDKQAHRTDVRKEFSIKTDCLVVGTAGQILQTKGQDIFIKAASILRKQYAGDMKFLIAGTGESGYVGRLVDLSKSLGIGDRVVFTGFRNDMPSVMSAMDIFVLATCLKEGLSRVIIEAMAAAKPVIATDIGGNAESVDNGTTGLLFPQGDETSLAIAMQRLLSDRGQSQKMGLAGRKKLEQDFNIEKNLCRLQAIYEELSCRKP
jgi:glycosyltransferase involved in cell wall biosynthesis